MKPDRSHATNEQLRRWLTESREFLALAVARNLPAWAESYKGRIFSLEKMLARRLRTNGVPLENVT